MDHDIAYANADFIEGAAQYPKRWQADAKAYRAKLAKAGRLRADVPYGSGARQVMDLFLPQGRPQGLVVFIHGGYWRMFAKDSWSHLAMGAVSKGWAVAMPSYTLTPEAQISEITIEAACAIECAAAEVSGPIILTGHSAGGHLVARMNCTDVTLNNAVAARIKRIVPISPVSDLRPLLETKMNADFQMDMAEATAESPLLHAERRGIETHVWVGADERPVFLDQARWLADAWDEAHLHIAPNLHHFNVIDGLALPNDPLLETLLAGT